MTAVTGPAQEYKISDAIITADRLGDNEVEVTFLIAEFTVFENIDKPYLTAQVAIMDDKGIFARIGFKGTEKLTLTISSTDEDLKTRGLQFTHTFNMTSIIKKIKVNDKTEMYVFSLIDEHAFIDSTIKISKSYKGKFEDIAASICASELNLNVDRSYFTPSVQDNVKVVIPYMSPLQAAKWLVNRASTENGSPFFIYSTLYDQINGQNGVRIGNLDVMLAQTPFNERIPYLYSSSLTNVAVTLPIEKQAMLIKDVQFLDLENTLELVDIGAIGSKVYSKDVFTSEELNGRHKVRRTLDKLQQSEVIPSNSKQTVFDEKQVIEEDGSNTTFLDDTNARVVSLLTSKGTYGKFKSYHDVENNAQLLNKVRRLSINSLLYRNMIDVTIPGLGFFATLKDGGRGVSVGDVVRINFLISDTSVESASEDAALDKEKSGDYLILRARNTFKDTEHNITLSITKLNNKPSDAV